MRDTIKLPSGLEPLKEWSPTRDEFFDALEIHFRMQPIKRRKKLIEDDWRAWSKAMKNDKPKSDE